MSRVSKSSPVSFPFSITSFLTLESFRTDVKLIERESFGNGSHLETGKSQILSDLTFTYGHVIHLNDKS